MTHPISEKKRGPGLALAPFRTTLLVKHKNKLLSVLSSVTFTRSTVFNDDFIVNLLFFLNHLVCVQCFPDNDNNIILFVPSRSYANCLPPAPCQCKSHLKIKYRKEDINLAFKNINRTDSDKLEDLTTIKAGRIALAQERRERKKIAEINLLILKNNEEQKFLEISEILKRAEEWIKEVHYIAC